MKQKDIKRIILPFLSLLLVFGCGKKQHSGAEEASTKGDIVSPKYAKGFNSTYREDGSILLDISDPEGREMQSFHFVLAPRGKETLIPDGYTRIDTPVTNVICMTSLQLSNFIKLGLTDLVKGITSTRHLHDEQMKKQLKDGATHKIGIEGNFDNEVIIALEPDMIFISPFKRGGYDALRNVDIPLVPHLGYKELSPLGQAEWIKVVGLLTGHEKEANEVFAGIEQRYNSLKDKVQDVKDKPKVMSGQMEGGHWYATGGKSFLANIFRDAGADYFLSDNEESGGVNVDFEKVYEKAADADYWRIVNSYDGEFGYDALREMDARYVDFKAYKDKGVIYCNIKETPFYERMPVEPEELLGDFIHIFHPDILPDRKMRYFKILK